MGVVFHPTIADRTMKHNLNYAPSLVLLFGEEAAKRGAAVIPNCSRTPVCRHPSTVVSTDAMRGVVPPPKTRCSADHILYHRRGGLANEDVLTMLAPTAAAGDRLGRVSLM